MKIKKMFRRFVAASAAAVMAMGMLSTSAFAAGVSVNSTNFPDANFRKYVSENIDKDKNNVLSDTEINDITEISVTGKSISSLKGIEYFSSLRGLNCYNNKLASLDVTQNTNLESLEFGYNALTSLNISKNTKLTELYCFNNSLTNLDVSKNPNLKELNCSANKLTSLDVSQNAKLEALRCAKNALTSLDVSQNANLKNLICDDNELAKLDLSRNANLEVLWCDNNKLTSLDVSGNLSLQYVTCKGNNLTSLDISKNTNLPMYNCVCNNNQYSIKAKSDRTFDLSMLPNGFDVSKASEWNGGIVSGNILTVNNGTEQVKYKYNIGKDRIIEFKLNVTVGAEIEAGDINGDGNITNADLVSLARYIVQLETELPYFDAADLNGDDNISNADIVILAQMLVA